MQLPVIGPDLLNEQIWRQAMDLYPKGTQGTANLEFWLTTGQPKDVKLFLEELRNRQKSSRLAKIFKHVQKCLDAIARYERALDMFAQAGGAPGCVAWGCIRIVLELVQGYGSEFERLVDVLRNTVTWLGPINVDMMALGDSELMRRSLLDLYVDIITFWSRAAAMYSTSKSSRLWLAVKSAWTDYRTEFKDLEQNMARDISIFLAAAAAEHHLKSERFQRDQTQAMDFTIRTNRQHLERVIRTWLSPPDDVPYDSDFYMSDLSHCCSARSEHSCEWIFDDPAYTEWILNVDNEHPRILCLNAIPGAGKSVLLAYITIRHFAAEKLDTFYFRFDSSDSYKRTLLGAAKCLLVQVRKRLIDLGIDIDEAIESAIDYSGSSKAKDARQIWKLLEYGVARLEAPLFIVDGLDECEQPDSLMDCLLSLVDASKGRVLVASRPSHQLLHSTKDLAIMTAGFQHRKDIDNYVTIRVTKSLACSSETKKLIIETLTRKHGNMFLWVKLVLAELELAFTEDEIKIILNKLPGDLEDMYRGIFSKLDKNLKPSQKSFCNKILKWLVCARRPLTNEELFEAIKGEYGTEAFLHTTTSMAEAIKSICGPLIVSNGGLFRLIHSTLMEYLTQPEPKDLAITFHIGHSESHTQILKKILDILGDEVSTGSSTSSYDPGFYAPPKDHLQTVPLLQYASVYWSHHAWNSNYSLEASKHLADFFSLKSSLMLLPLYLVSDRGGLERLRYIVIAMIRSIQLARSGVTPMQPINQAYDMCLSWGRFAVEFLDEYGDVLAADPENFSPFSPNLGTFDNKPPWFRADTETHMKVIDHLQRGPSFHVSYKRKLFSGSSEEGSLGFLIPVEQLDALVYAEGSVNLSPQVFIQHISSGSCLTPAGLGERSDSFDKYRSNFDQIRVLGADFDQKNSILAVVYGATGASKFFACAWKVRQFLDFATHDPSYQWCDLILCKTTYHPRFEGSPAPVLFDNSGRLMSPVGIVNTTTLAVKQFPLQFAEHKPGKSVVDGTTPKDKRKIMLFGDGLMILYPTGRSRTDDGRTATVYSSNGVELRKIRFGNRRRISEYCGVMAISPSGRLIAYLNGMSKGQRVELLNVDTGEEVTLFRDWLDWDPHKFLFSEDERYLVVANLSTEIDEIQIQTWLIDAPEPEIVAEREYRGSLRGLNLNNNGSMLYLVTTQRVITRLKTSDLSEIDEYPNYTKNYDDKVLFFVSNTGDYLTNIRRSATELVIQITGLNARMPTNKLTYLLPSNVNSRPFRVAPSGNLCRYYFSDEWNTICAAFLEAKETSDPWALEDAPQNSYVVPKQASLEVVESDHLYYYHKSEFNDGISYSFESQLEKETSRFHLSANGRLLLKTVDPNEQNLKLVLKMWVRPAWDPANHRLWTPVEPLIDSDLILLALSSVNFHAFQDWCILTLWSDTTRSNDHSFGNVQCFLLAPHVDHIRKGAAGDFPNSETSTNTKPDLSKLVQPEKIGEYVVDSQKSQVKSWSRSTILSRCGTYLLLTVSTSVDRWQRIMDIPDRVRTEMRNFTAQKLPENPRVISEKTYWYNHCYWISVYNQRVLLNRSYRLADRRDYFSDFTCHVQLAIVPQYLVASKMSLLVAESCDENSRLLIVPEESAPLLFFLALSWDQMNSQLDDICNNHGVDEELEPPTKDWRTLVSRLNI